MRCIERSTMSKGLGSMSGTENGQFDFFFLASSKPWAISPKSFGSKSAYRGEPDISNEASVVLLLQRKQSNCLNQIWKHLIEVAHIA